MRSASEFHATLPIRLLITCILSSLAALTGCVSPQVQSDASEPYTASVLGNVHGGQQPVSGAHIYVLQAAVTGYNAQSINIGAPAVAVTRGGGRDSFGPYFVSDASGAFNISNGYTCTPNSLVYLLALGGNPGLGPGKTNSALALASVLGQCPPVNSFQYSTPFLQINELTSVAAVYSLSGFMSGPTQVSSGVSAVARKGLLNAFLNSSQLVNIVSGSALDLTPNGRGAVPASTIRTLADIIAPCVNSDGSGSPCSSLFAATSTGSNTPSDTLSALLNIAHSPASNVATLYSLITAAAPFQPVLQAAPTDLTISIAFDSGNGSPGLPAIDSSGSVWLPNTASSTLTILNSLGSQIAILTPLGALYGTSIVPVTPPAVAVDQSGFGWLNSTTSGVVEAYSPTRGAGVADGGGMNHQDATFGLALNSKGDAFVTDQTSKLVAAFDNNGNALSGANGFANGSSWSGIVIDGNDRFFVADPAANRIVGFNGSGTPAIFLNGLPAVISGGGLNQPNSLALDASGNLWATNANNSLSRFQANTGIVLSETPYTGGGLSFDIARQSIVQITLDGAGSVWIPNYAGSSISHFSASGLALSPDVTGFPTPGCVPNGLAADQSGDLWVTCASTSQPVREYIGIATPVSTPLTPLLAGTLP